MFQSDLITVNPEIVSGTAVFTGSRVPIKALFDYVSGNHTLDDFLDDFPTVRREQAVELLELASRMVFASLPPDSE